MTSRLHPVKLLFASGLSAWIGLTAGVFAAEELGESVSLETFEGAIAQSSEADSYAIIHVNSTSGSDAQGDGTQLRPLKTITHALEQAEENTLILLSGGIYSEESGESFPIRLKSGVTVQGTLGFSASDIIIQGNGGYYSTLGGLRNVAILGSNNAGLANVAISNPHPEGIGIWIESDSPIILNNAFLYNGANGIYIVGDGDPVIRGNYFSENGQAGLVIAGPSSATVDGNIFENTGTGIMIAPGATPQVLNNRISQNVDGLVVHADAQPILQNNQIFRNRRNSILDYAAWTDTSNSMVSASQPPPPTLAVANSSESQGNEMVAMPSEHEQVSTGAPSSLLSGTADANESITAASEAQVEVPADTAVSQTVSAELSLSEPMSDPDFNTPSANGVESPPAENIDEAPASEVPNLAIAEPTTIAASDSLGTGLQVGINQTSAALSSLEIAFVATTPVTPVLGSIDLASIAVASEEVAVRFSESAPAPDSVEEAAERSSSETALSEPSLSLNEVTEDSSDRDFSISEELSGPDTVELPIVPPPIDTVATPAEVPASTELSDGGGVEQTPGDVPELPSSTSDEAAASDSRLTVPTSDIPMGSGGGLSELFTTGAAAISTEGPPPPPTLASALGLNYRVLVDATHEQVQEIVPDAFPVRVDGQPFMQAGAYPTLAEAESKAREITQAGLPAQVTIIP